MTRQMGMTFVPSLAMFLLAMSPPRHVVRAAGEHAKPSEQVLAAKLLVEQLVTGKFEAAASGFDATLSRVMPVAKLDEAWRKAIGESGEFREVLDTREETVTQGGKAYQVVIVACRFEKGAHDVRVVFDPERKVGGLFLGALRPVLAGKEELWLGELDVGVAKLRLLFRLGKSPEGKPVATLDSLSQGLKGFVFDTVEIQDRQIRLEAKKLLAVFAGQFSEDRKELVGHWRQAGQELPLKLARVESEPRARRPQTPREPLGYTAREVTYENAAAGVRLAGTLTVPDQPGRYPAVILITGSGAQDRDETLFEHKPFWVLADAISRHGFAVLRVDDRGVGGSTGNVARSTSADFAGDVEAGIEFLKEQADIDSSRIGLLGHSEGGVIAPMVAARNGSVAFLILLAGTAFPGEEILYQQGAAQLQAAGASPDQLARQRLLQESMFRALEQAKSDDEARAGIIDAMVQSARDEGQKDEAILATVKTAAGAEADRLLSPWFRYFLKHDPRESLRQVKCPVLALNGSLDRQVLPQENLREIREALASAGNREVEIHELPSLNHLFQTAKTGLTTEYGDIEETIAPSVLELITKWLTARGK